MLLDLVMGLHIQEAVGDTTVNDFVVDQREKAEFTVQPENTYVSRLKAERRTTTLV